MTTQQLHLFNALYLVVFLVVVVATRAPARRIVGALMGESPPEALKRLWKLEYEELAVAPGEPGARLREARFIMQARVAFETRRLGIIMAIHFEFDIFGRPR